MSFQNDKDTIQKIIQIINRAWLTNHLDVLSKYFDEKIVIISQDIKNKTIGRDKCILNYKQFIESAKILDYNQSEPLIEFWSNTGVAVYNYALSYIVNNRKICESGEDIFVFNKEEEDSIDWKAVMKTVKIFEKKQSY